jgi:hypothetical protein
MVLLKLKKAIDIGTAMLFFCSIKLGSVDVGFPLDQNL